MQELNYVNDDFCISNFIDSLPIRKINTSDNLAFYVGDIAKMLNVSVKAVTRNCEPHHIFSPNMINKYNIKTYRLNGKSYKQALLTEQGLYHVLSTIGYNIILAQYRRWDELRKTRERINSGRLITITKESEVTNIEERSQLIKSILKNVNDFNELKEVLTIFQIKNDLLKACQENLHCEDEDEVDTKLRLRDMEDSDEITVHSVRALQKCWENYPSLKPELYRYKITTNASYLDFSTYETKYRIHCSDAKKILDKISSRMIAYEIDCKENNIFECNIVHIKDEIRRTGEKCIWEEVITDFNELIKSSSTSSYVDNTNPQVSMDVPRVQPSNCIDNRIDNRVSVYADSCIKNGRNAVDSQQSKKYNKNENENENEDEDIESEDSCDWSDGSDDAAKILIDNDRYQPGEKPKYTCNVKTNIYDLPDTEWYLERKEKNELGF